MIPARLGSKRVKNKNLRMLGEKPLVQHVIDSLKQTNLFDKIYINSEGDVFKEIAENNNINFYKRPEELASDSATNDEFVDDFLNNVSCKNIFQILPTSPFVTSKDINEFYKYFFYNKCETLISQKEVRIECTFKKKPINYEKNKQTPPSQELTPIMAYACSLMAWNSDTFQKNMKKFKCAYHGPEGKTDYFTLDGLATIDIDEEFDFMLAEQIYKSLN